MPGYAPILERLLRHIVIDPVSGCWIWTGCIQKSGYGQIGGEAPSRRIRRVHIVSYELHVGPVPPGLKLDHICHKADGSCPGGFACRHRRCCNPAHVEPVTHGENVRRGMAPLVNGRQQKETTHCPQGHAYNNENTGYFKNNNGNLGRRCKACCRDMANARYQKEHPGMKARKRKGMAQ
jgi:hypothetical protein